MQDIYIFMAVYWCIGVAWLGAGFLPRRWGGWLTVEHECHPLARVLFIVIGGAIWPLILAKILYSTCVKGERYTSL